MASKEQSTNLLVTALTKLLINYARPLLDNSDNESAKPFTRSSFFLPHVTSRWWGWTHYAVSIAGLPEPYRYLNIMTFIGQSGILFMDNDYLCAPDARNTATVLASTAYGEEHHYEAYDVQTSCLFEEDGSRLAWGNDLVIEIDFPNITIAGSFRHMTVDLKIVVSEHAAWFSRTPIYDHVCLLSDYQGTIKDMRGITPISGVCSFEYAHAMSLQSLQRQPIPTHLKIPVDFFTYQIVHLDRDTQLLLDKVTAGGTVIDESARLCSRHGGVQVYKDVDFEVLEYKQSRITNPRDRAMRVPSRLCWTVREAGGTVLTLSACVDAPLRFGLCRGYVGGYSFTGKWRGKAVKGNGYLEWVNVAD